MESFQEAGCEELGHDSGGSLIAVGVSGLITYY